MKTYREKRIISNSEKLATLINLMNKLADKPPEKLRFMESGVDGRAIIEIGTDNLKVEKYGVAVDTKALIPVKVYLTQCLSNGEIEDIVIGIYMHSNEHGKNAGNGQCEIEDADFAEVSVITSEKTITMYLNYQNPITKKIGNYVNIHNTSWKQLPDIRFSNDRRLVLIERIIVTAALVYERQNNVKFKTKEEFMKVFNSVKALEPDVIAKRVKEEGELNSIRNIWSIDITYDCEAIKMLKMVYNKLKNESLRVCGSRAFDDRTYIAFENGASSIGFEVGLNSMKVEHKIGR